MIYSKLTLGQKQRVFPTLVSQLIDFVYASGYEITFGDAYRDPRVFGGQNVKKSYSAAKSAHKNRLAIDLNLFKNGVYLTRTEDHAFLGQRWEELGGYWGGHFGDGNHYSLEHGGVK